MRGTPHAGPALRLFGGMAPIQRREIWKDVLAGVTLAALAIPEVMGYTRIARTPVITGLYTLVLPVIAFAVLGSSRHLVVAADSATAAILAGSLAHYAAPFSAQYVALSGLLALLCGGMVFLARIFRLGLLADFLSRSALIGFLTGVGVQVAGGELTSLLGIPNEGQGLLPRLAHLLGTLGLVRPWTALLGGAVVLAILALGRVAPRFPGALIAVIGAIAASWLLDLPRYGIQSIGAIPAGLPRLTHPQAAWSLAPRLLVTAASCSLVIIAQSAATSRSYALRFAEALNEDQDMVGLAFANAAAAATGTFVVNGSPTKTEMVDLAGGRSQLAQLTMAAVTLVVLLFLTRPLSAMPAVVLSAVVFLIGVRLIDLGGFRELYRRRPDEFWIAGLTALTVAVVGVEEGILLAIVISIVDHLRVSYHPPTRLLQLSASGTVSEAPVSSEAMALPGLMVYRFEAPLYYANAEFFMSEVLRLVRDAAGPVRWFVVRFDSISDVDYSASKMLIDLIGRLRARDVAFVVTDVAPDLRALLRRLGVLEALPSERVFADFHAAVAAFRREETA